MHISKNIGIPTCKYVDVLSFNLCLIDSKILARAYRLEGFSVSLFPHFANLHTLYYLEGIWAQESRMPQADVGGFLGALPEDKHEFMLLKKVAQTHTWG